MADAQMDRDADPPPPAMSLHPAVVVGLSALAGLVVGALLWLATDSLSNSDIAGGRFRGNGALVVPFAVGPYLLAAGWTMLTLWFRGNRRWPWAGLLVALLAVPYVLLAGFAVPMAFESVGPAAGLVAQVVATAVVPLAEGIGLAALFGRLTRRGVLAGLAVALLALAGNLLPIGYILAIFLLPLIVVMPLLVGGSPVPHARPVAPGWLAAGYILLPVALVAGLVLVNLARSA